MYRYPFAPYPSSWYRVAWSDDLPPGRVLPLRLLGRDLVAFRTASGRAAVLDAHCPHNGAHLGVGGCVAGESIRCPFHAWEFAADGRCTRVPGRPQPPRAGVGAWTVREVNGAVVVWYDATGAAPTWELPRLRELDLPGWTPLRPAGTWKIRVHVQELMENAVDTSHFNHVHTHVTESARSEGLELDGPVAVHSMSIVLAGSAIMGLRLPSPPGTLATRLDGLGMMTSRSVVEMKPRISYTACYFVTPTDEEHVEVSAKFTLQCGLPWPLSAVLVRQTLAGGRLAMEQDIPIFEHKVFRERPLVQPHDGPITRYREWVKQFYPALAAPLVPASRLRESGVREVVATASGEDPARAAEG